MKKLFYLIAVLLIVNTLSAQNKNLTIYYSGDSTRVVNIANVDSMTIFICGVSKVNYGGKDYNTVLIGDQCWLKENLDIGTRINSGTTASNNQVIEKYCQQDLPANCDIYGGLYVWDEAMQYVITEGAQGICPSGWHIPSDAEFRILESAVNNDGNALKEIGQGTGSGAGTNTSGFSALLAGGYSPTLSYGDLGVIGYFWSSTEYNINPVWARYMHLKSTQSSVLYSIDLKVDAMSIRCIKD
jgi:uncharacterized protein (TIGR02145 family)